LEAGEVSTIENLFSSRLSFGTAGLRAELGPGPMRMNRLVVSQTAKGIADFLNKNRDSYLDGNGELSAVIGFDARKNSEIFAKDSAEILQAEGIAVELFDQQVPTPVVAFTAKRQNSSLAIMVTASHNPPNDNGYKVYLGGSNGGSQIISPQDSEIANSVSENVEINPSNRAHDYKLLGDREIALYLKRCEQLSQKTASDLKIVYTAMHGVGWKVASKIFKQSGFENIYPVKEQIEPDPDFPTVEFPNPEEAGAMDLALAEARRVSADLIIANDPDADRLAVGIPSGGDYRMLTGNELGILLADYVAQRNQSGTMAASYVSSRQLVKIAENNGLESELTPTGFKWIAKVDDLIFGFEEALGYCVDPRHTPDKDGLTAALYVCQIADELSKQGVSIKEKLDLIADQTGYFETGQISIRFQSLELVQALLSKIKTATEFEIDGKSISIKNLAEIDPRLDMLEIAPDENSRALIRASGTEPKLKCYLEVQAEDKDKAVNQLQNLKKMMKQFLEQ
jgi:phosphomannomutase